MAQPKHSPLGFSGAERWSNCPGSVALIAALPPDTVQADPEYRRAGVAAHAAWAHCLRTGLDAWEVAYLEWEGYKLSADEFSAGQLYLDTVREAETSAGIATGRWQSHHLIEETLHAPSIHELAYGTIDHAFIVAGHHAEITDYKHGEGIFVEVEHNWQLMGYAALVLDRYPEIEQFRLRICQPRCPFGEPVREWEISAADLRWWIKHDLVPAMRLTEMPDWHLKPGEWCRFCPVKEANACPALAHDLAVVEQVSPLVERMSDARLGELFAKTAPVKMMIKAIEDEALRRRLAGIDVPGTKTVAKKSWRVWKDSAKVALLAALGDKAMADPELKTPAAVEKLGVAGKELVREYAYSPDAGYTIALESDRRAAVSLPAAPSETFRFAIDNNENS